MSSSASARDRSFDGLSVVDLWHILLRRWRWIFVSIILCILAAVAYLAVKAPVYQAAIKLRIGQVAAGGPFEGAEVLASRLLAQHGELVADGIKRSRPFLVRANASRDVPNAIELVAEGYTPQDAADLLERVSAQVLKTHDQTYGQSRALLEERLQKLDAQRTALQEQYQDASALMEQLKDDNPVQASLVAFERGRISGFLVGLDAEKPVFAQKLAPPQTQPTEILGTITAPAKAASPKKALLLVLATTLGLLAGVVLAFFAEFVASSRRSAARSA
jgi:hypothetical protein